LPPGTTTNSSIAARGKASHTPHSFPSEGLRPCSQRCSTRSPRDSAHRPRQVALAWLLQHSPTILLIPGTSSLAHLRENIAAANIELPADAAKELDRIGTR
jgi:aryl-alcohol dehydrogenase-like predicted oxidoreductase